MPESGFVVPSYTQRRVFCSMLAPSVPESKAGTTTWARGLKAEESDQEAEEKDDLQISRQRGMQTSVLDSKHVIFSQKTAKATKVSSPDAIRSIQQ